MNHDMEPAAAEIRKLREENLRLISCVETLELNASQTYHTLISRLSELEIAYQDISEKYAFCDRHYQMTQRHADNLQALLDNSSQECAKLRDELMQSARHAQNLQGLLDSRNETIDRLHYSLSCRDAQLQEHQKLFSLQEEELQQTRRHAQNLQAVQQLWNEELQLARRHAQNLQQALDSRAHNSIRARAHRIKERVYRWFK